MKYCSRKIIICVLLLFILVLSASAATLGEMRENGEVSDGGISYGDERDGIVSDVSDDRGSMLPNSGSRSNSGSGALQGGSGSHSGTSQSGSGSSGSTSHGGSVLGGIGSDISRGVNDMTRSGDSNGTADSGNGTTGTNNSEGGGISAGLIIAILVVVAVLVIIFILLPKRR